MAQASSAQREPSMEEILASIRRIIEDNDAGRKQGGEPELARAAAPSSVPAQAERTVIEVDAFRNELRTPPAEAPAQREAPQKKPTLAEIQAQVSAEAAAMPSRWMDPAPAAPSERPVAERSVLERPAPERSMSERPSFERSPDDIKKAIENSRAAREDARALLGIPEAANTARPPEPRKSEPAYAREAEIEERPTMMAQSRPAVMESAAPKPALLSERVERQVAASFSELSEAFAVRSRKTFDEMAEEMIAPLLRDWMENNLPTLVERLVREEIERVARGTQ
jgi:cell pole-organizing protein PopZ